MSNEAIPTPASLQPAPIQQTPADAATEQAIESHITGAPPEKSEQLFNRSTVEHRRQAASQEKPDPDSWRDGTDIAPLAPMPAAPMLEAREIEAAIETLNWRGFEHADLVKEWGDSFGENLAYAKSAFKSVVAAHPDLVARFDNNGLGDHPAILQFLAQHGRLTAGLMGDNTISQRNIQMPNRTTPAGPAGNNRGSEETRTELNELMRANPPGSGNYKLPHVQQRVQHLNSILAGSGAVVGRGGRTA
jgi:hypothetical protein